MGIIVFRWHPCLCAIAKMVSMRYQSRMIHTPQTPDRIADLLVHVGRVSRSENARSELTAAQWTCLRFFARANSSSRTPSAFASFQATTRGTASQIVKLLERRGLVTRTRSERDRRSVCFDLTEKGRAMLAQDPLRDLIGVIDNLGAAESEHFLKTLSRLAFSLARRRDIPAFGTCRDCGHFDTARDTAYCACMAEELAAGETHKLCASHRPALGAWSQGDGNGAR